MIFRAVQTEHTNVLSANVIHIAAEELHNSAAHDSIIIMTSAVVSTTDFESRLDAILLLTDSITQRKVCSCTNRLSFTDRLHWFSDTE